jgi:hypothetical protein
MSEGELADPVADAAERDSATPEERERVVEELGEAVAALERVDHTVLEASECQAVIGAWRTLTDLRATYREEVAAGERGQPAEEVDPGDGAAMQPGGSP